jgi:2-C-methyl-D-erythritol 2,4-cyclodiphosphate synthase
MPSDYRIGHGFDVHRFRRGRKFVLGGIRIPYPFGLQGHSDADVLIHALMNALLGAIGKGDIGSHFPDTDARYEGISSKELLVRVLRMVKQDGFSFTNGDVTLLAQKPLLRPFFPKIKRRLSQLLKVPQSCLNIKAVTTEGLGWIGQGRGMAATAVVLLRKRQVKQTK